MSVLYAPRDTRTKGYVHPASPLLPQEHALVTLSMPHRVQPQSSVSTTSLSPQVGLPSQVC